MSSNKSIYAPLPRNLRKGHAGDGADVVELVEGLMINAGGHSATSARKNIASKLDNRSLMLANRPATKKTSHTSATPCQYPHALRFSRKALKRRLHTIGESNSAKTTWQHGLILAEAFESFISSPAESGRAPSSTTPSSLSPSSLTKKCYRLAQAPMFGARLSVDASASRPQLVGIEGIVTGDTHGTWTLVCPNESSVVVPKAGSRFTLMLGKAMGKAAVLTEEGARQAKLPTQNFIIHGDHWVGRKPGLLRADVNGVSLFTTGSGTGGGSVKKKTRI